MNIALLIVGSVFAGIAALIHLYIWLLESVLWTRESTRRTFGVRSADEAETLRGMAYNQGFYNLFLALGVIVGIVLAWTAGLQPVGLGLLIFATLSMVLAAVVLLSANSKMLRAALVQGAAPLIAVLSLVAGLLVG